MIGMFGAGAHTRIRRAVSAVDWELHTGVTGAVPVAFEWILAADTRPAAEAAYAAMLDAIGHNHSGQLYEPSVPAAPLLVQVVRETEGWSRWAAIEVLIDCLSWVQDDQQFIDHQGTAVHLTHVLQTAVEDLRDGLRTMAVDQRSAVPTAQSARELLRALDEINHEKGAESP